MSAISSLYKYSSVTAQDIERVGVMTNQMHYRGTEIGIWQDVHYLTKPLVSTSIGKPIEKPISNEDGSLVLVCDGTIYNYTELKQSLEAKGHIFATESDTECVVHLYEEYGYKCVEHLRGVFALCVYDVKQQELFVARDRMGEKTLYYAEIPCGVVCATELKAILKACINEPQLDVYQLVSPIRYTGPVDNEKTYIKQIKRLGPGEYLVVNANGVKRSTYWDRHLLRETRVDVSFDEAKKQVEHLLRESVDMCLRSDAPLAIMLSGGIDSSLVAKLAKDIGREVHTITAGYQGMHACDERDVARRFAAEQGFIHHEIELTEEDFNACFEEFTQYMDEPITDAAAMAQWALFKKVKSLGFDVLLGGMGGDELFFGYPYWNMLGESYALKQEHESLFPIKKNKKRFVEFMLKNWKKVLYAHHPYEISDKALCYWMRNDYYRFAENARCTHTNEIFALKDLQLQLPFPNVARGKEIEAIYDFQIDNIMTRAYLYLSDREGMGNGLEVRSPLIDYKLVEYVSALPMEIKYKSGNPKYFLKEVLRGIIPDYILFAQKRGFTPPNTFVQNVVDGYKYEFFDAKHKFYNSVLADRVCSLLLK